MFEDLYGDIPNLFPRRFERAPDGTPRPKVPPLTPEEEDSLLGKVAGAGLGGLAYAGSVLEKTFGKRALMGGLTGNTRELLSVLPFSDTLGITDPDERVGGRELLRHYGLAGPEDNWGNFAAGLGLDIGLDPATYLSFGAGALTKGGQVAKKAGMLPRTTAERVGTTLNDLLAVGPPTPALSDALGATLKSSGKTLADIGNLPLGYSVGFGLPFGTPVAGLGESGLALARGARQGAGLVDSALRSVPLLGHQYGWTADKLGQAGDWAYRMGRSLFDSRVKGATSHLGQETAADATLAELPIMAEYRRRAMGYADELAQHGLDESGDVLRQVAEGTFNRAVASPHPVIESVATRMRGDLDEMLKRLQGMGVNVQGLADMYVKYLPRYATPLTKPTGGVLGRAKQALATSDPRMASREEILSNIRGGTDAINRMVADPDVYHAASPIAAADLIRDRYLFTPQEMQELHTLNNTPAAQLTPAMEQTRNALRQRFEQADSLADWVRSLDPQFAASNMAGANTSGPLRYFGNHPLADYQTYFDRAARVLGAADATQGLLARTATLGAPAGGGYVSAREALRRAGLVGPGGALPGGETELLARFNQLRQAPQAGGPGMAATSAMDLMVPENVVNEATRYLSGFRSPDAVGAIGSVLDSLTNWTKAFQTAVWPAFNVRNLVSGQYQNWVKGMGEAPGGMLKQVSDAYKLARGQVLDDANMIAEFARRGLTPQEATREIAREMYAYGVGGHLPHLTREAIGPGGGLVNTGTDLASFRGRAVGTNPSPTVGEIARNYIPTSGEQINPLNVAGVNTNADLFAPVAAGRQAGDLVENINRGSLYLSLRRQGYSAEEAAREVLAAHFDYTRAAKTDFEKTIMSRLIPFYTFSRQNIPYQIEQLLQRPGGPTGQLAKAALDARQGGGFLPDYLGGGLAIPTGGEDESGTRRYLTRLDLPPEQAFELVRGGPNWLADSMMGVLGQTNPILKAPVEYATGKQFYTGRDLGDLHSMTGSILLDQMLANSPLSRAATTARTLADERKWRDLDAMAAIPLNLLTGVRVSDVDTQRAKDQAARNFIQDTLRGNEAISKFESFSPKPGAEMYLTPEEWAMLRLSRTLEQQAQKRAKESKKK